MKAATPSSIISKERKFLERLQMQFVKRELVKLMHFEHLRACILQIVYDLLISCLFAPPSDALGRIPLVEFQLNISRKFKIFFTFFLTGN